MKSAILLALTSNEDPLGLLAPSVGGVVPPWMWERPECVGYGGHGKRVAETMPARWLRSNSLLSVPERKRPANVTRALLLSLDGTPDDLGMARALHVAHGFAGSSVLDDGRIDPERIAAFIAARSPAYRAVRIEDGAEVSDG